MTSKDVVPDLFWKDDQYHFKTLSKGPVQV